MGGLAVAMPQKGHDGDMVRRYALKGREMNPLEIGLIIGEGASKQLAVCQALMAAVDSKAPQRRMDEKLRLAS